MMEISLRIIEPKDAELISLWFSDKEMMKYMSTVVRSRIHTPESVKRDILESDSDYERLFMVCVDDCPVGHAGIDDIDLNDMRGEIFFLIGDKNYLGKGLGKMIVKKLLSYGFNELGLHSIFATAASDNYASLKILRSSGFKKIGVRRDYNRINGEFMDEVMFDIIEEEHNE